MDTSEPLNTTRPDLYQAIIAEQCLAVWGVRPGQAWGAQLHTLSSEIYKTTKLAGEWSGKWSQSSPLHVEDMEALMP